MGEYHWKSKSVKSCGVDDMVLLPKIEVAAISENLQKRLMEDRIYTYIGPVLIAVNPFKAMDYFTDKEIEQYMGSTSYENPPHIYSLCDESFKNLMTEKESQCVIISGESGAGKTVSAKYVMNYITKVSGGGESVQNVKDIILQSNPLLEAFGNAKTLRNDNSSRFGKYVEIQFKGGSVPCGGKISNFLLEKSRVVTQNKGERNFHIFYQLLMGLDNSQKRTFGLTNPSDFIYTSQSECTSIAGVDDGAEYNDVLKAMQTVGLKDDVKNSIIQLMAGILHLGNVTFTEEKNHAHPVDSPSLEHSSNLLQVDKKGLVEVLVSREMESKWGKTSETIKLEHNLEQANFTRDAIAKTIYARVFDFLVQEVNNAIETQNAMNSIGILDIYGFEIFSKNGFEQFCINYVNEKLQQIFIELTLKKEQEEYVSEGIKWEPIKYFNNRVVCDLIESKKAPVGVMSVLDDVCATMHAKGEGADQKLIEDLGRTVGCHEHFNISGAGFIISHYAGKVTYDCEGFCEKNRDVLFNDPINLMKSSSIKFLVKLFPEDTQSEKKGRPTTASSKIKTQANTLVEKLMKCQPHYIRCIKPNETKKPYDFDAQRVKHQIEYQGLKENIRIKRAGFAYRREFDKFLERYAVLTPETYPTWRGDPKEGISHIMNSVSMDASEWQLGKSMVFIKKPESLFLLEEVRDRKFDVQARVIQGVWKKFHNESAVDRERENAAKILCMKKKRYYGSINRKFFGNYINLDEHPALCSFLEKKERCDFSMIVAKYDRRFKSSLRDMLVTQKNIYLIGREKVKKGADKGKIIDILKRKIRILDVSVEISPFQDDLIVINVANDHSTLVQLPLKTELLYILSKFYTKESGGKTLQVTFSEKMSVSVKKKGFGGGKKLTVEVKEDDKLPNNLPEIKVSSSKMMVSIKPGSSASSMPKQSQAFASKAYSGQSRQTAQTKENMPTTSQAASSTQLKNTMGQPIPATPQKSKPLPVPKKAPRCVGVWAFEAREEDELSFKVDDVIEILNDNDEGWWSGRLNGKTGIFPSNYVKRL